MTKMRSFEAAGATVVAALSLSGLLMLSGCEERPYPSAAKSYGEAPRAPPPATLAGAPTPPPVAYAPPPVAYAPPPPAYTYSPPPPRYYDPPAIVAMAPIPNPGEPGSDGYYRGGGYGHRIHSHLYAAPPPAYAKAPPTAYAPKALSPAYVPKAPPKGYAGALTPVKPVKPYTPPKDYKPAPAPAYAAAPPKPTYAQKGAAIGAAAGVAAGVAANTAKATYADKKAPPSAPPAAKVVQDAKAAAAATAAAALAAKASVVPPKAVAPPSAAMAPAAPPASTAASTADRPTRLAALQSSLTDAVSKGAVLTAPARFTANQPADVSLTIPAAFADTLRTAAQKNGLGDAAASVNMNAVLSGDGFSVTPDETQSQPLTVGQPTEFRWTVTAQPGAKGPLHADVGADLLGGGSDVLALGSVQKQAGFGVKPTPRMVGAAILVLILALVVVWLARGRGPSRPASARRASRAASRGGARPLDMGGAPES